jgi:hypothetical protein
LEIQLQMHSKDPTMVHKYLRDRLTLPCNMVQQLTKDIKKAVITGGGRPSPATSSTAAGPHPARVPTAVEDSSDSSSSPDDSDKDGGEESQVAFWVKTGLHDKINPRWKFHVPDLDDDAKVACGPNYLTDEYTCVGHKPPASSRVCRKCMSVRPDVAAIIGNWNVTLA